MGCVTGLEEKNRLVSVYVDGLLLCRVDKKTFARHPLEEGEPIEEEVYLDRLAASQQKKAFEMALSLLDVCDRTEKQVVDKLRYKGIVEGAARAAAQRLKEMGLVNDQAYAQRMVQRQSQKAVGRYQVKRKLLGQGIDGETAQAALEELDGQQQQEACLQAARSLYRRYRDQEPRAARRKLGQALGRRGFGWDDITGALEKIMGEDEEWE